MRPMVWFRGLSKTGKVIVVAVVSMLSFGTIGAMAQPDAQQPPSSSVNVNVVTPKPQPKVETKTITEAQAVAYASSTVEDPNLAQGVTETRTLGVNGMCTLTYEVIYTDGVETSRKETGNIVTTEPINQVVAKGTKAPAPAQTTESSCPNGTYTNANGSVVCRPYQSGGAPAGATAQCRDGSYSFSQSRRGTCSGHGGVAAWL